MAASGAGYSARNSHDPNLNRKPSHLSIDSSSANNAFLHTLNSQLQIAANKPSQVSHQHESGAASDFPLTVGIDRAALIAPDFDTDEFLSARRHLPLEELKSQLSTHMKELKTELIELINSDYADFINLSTNLNGVDRMMEELQKPLDRMKGDAIAVKSNLQSVMDNLEDKLKHRAEIREKKTSLQLLLNISDISVAKRLERVAIEYNQMQYLVSKGANLPFVTNIDWRLVRIKETMSENLSSVLRTCIHPGQSEADSTANKESLTQCLRTYALIDQTAEAELVITEDLLTPFVNKTITRSALDPAHANITKNNQTNGHPHERLLVTMYNQILAFIDTHCSTIINVTQKELKGTNFDIPVNCIWGVTTQTILKNIPTIFSSGNPDQFHRNYTDTMAFVSKIEELCGSRRSLTRLRSLPNYQSFMKKWQLVAYFKLRFMEISSSIEDALQANVDAAPRSPNANEHLPASNAIVNAIERCWSTDVFIYGIADNFWKLTLQLMARYSIWISANLAKDLEPAKDKGVQSRSSSPAPGSNPRSNGRSTPAPTPLRASGPIGKASLEEMMLQQLSMIVNDIDHVASRIQSLLENQIRPKLPPSMADEPVLRNSFQQSLDSIRQDVPAVQQRITDLITKRCVDILNNIKEITSKYGEGPPKEPSHFVAQILEPLAQYITGSGSVLRSESRQEWTLEVIAATTLKYSAILEERLLKIKNREEQTNKVKTAGMKARGGVGGAGGIGGLLNRPTLPNAFSSNNGAVSDADKIRLQYVLDVQFYKSENCTQTLFRTRTCLSLLVSSEK
ncbi:Conserved oligomeric Golgi complex subunit 2 [Podila minutissima]|uniref:Conserved oligomeric Golgi complex subunit 2 n=1 Tax=Podila minutissima TaxID=64525 RepID=A0A9P5SHK7_9FUNG|nr:Conserved oligomeric Golgi complex subunit 2 [Podila minutissima]